MKRKGFGKRTFAAFLAASMILSVSTEMVSAAVQNQSNSVSEVAEASSTAVSSADKSTTAVTVVAESVSLNAVKAPTGL